MEPVSPAMARPKRGVVRATMLRAFGLAIVVLFCAISGYAQVTASLSGTITDPSGAAVSAAAVTVRNINTEAIRSDVTDGYGHYQIPSLAVGEYEISVRKSGFAETIRAGIHLAVDQAAGVNIQLRVGDVNQQVVVHADAPLVNVNTGDISGLVGERQISRT